MLNGKPISLNDMVENIPVIIDFYPSDAVLHKLMMRSIQLTEENWADELWQGFKITKLGRSGCCKGKVYFAPKELLHG